MSVPNSKPIFGLPNSKNLAASVIKQSSFKTKF
jgi:hypothetical protein